MYILKCYFYSNSKVNKPLRTTWSVTVSCIAITYQTNHFERRATSVPKTSSASKAKASGEIKEDSKTATEKQQHQQRGKSPAKTTKKKKAAPLTMAALQAAKKEQMAAREDNKKS